jgi:hypothetical protein
MLLRNTQGDSEGVTDMAMTAHRIGTLVEVFNDAEDAQNAVRELKALGFTDSQIGIVSLNLQEETQSEDISEIEEIEGGAAAGAAAGLGIGALWGLAILAGIVPGIGPAIAGGTLGLMVSSAAAGAATAGLAGALIGVGVSHEEADHYQDQFTAGQTIVTVKAGARADIACSVLNRFNGSEQVVPFTEA